MIKRTNLEVYLNKLLACEQFNDYAPNGLQIEGRGEISTICSAVTASLAVIEEAIVRQADALIVHHGYFWKGESTLIRGIKKKRIQLLLLNNISLLAYHLPLDCHQTLGNNAKIAELLEVNDIDTHAVNGVNHLLWSGKLKNKLTAFLFKERLTSIFGQAPLMISSPERAIQSIAWCSGAAQDYIEYAASLGVDAYFSGEVSERTYYQALELDIGYFACGHHATERAGIQALAEHLAFEFALQHHFIDSSNPI